MKPSHRYECKACGTKFSVKLDPQQRHYRREINEPFFLALVNKGVVNRVIEKYEINPKTVYDKIEFIYQQCLQFDRWHRPFVRKALKQHSPVLSTDRQFYLSNWGDHNMPMPTRIVNTSTVENESGFVLAATVNFDYTSDASFIRSENQRIKDIDKPIYYRRYSQYVLSEAELETPDEDDAIVDVPLQPPTKGLLVHQTYSMAAHFYEIASLLRECDSVMLFADRDAGFRSVIPAIFQEMIQRERLDAFQLATQYSGAASLIDQNTRTKLKAQYKQLKEKYPEDGHDSLMRRMWQQPITQPIAAEQIKSEWLINPRSTSRIAAISPLSYGFKHVIDRDMGEEIANVASLSGVDNWFQILRRRLNMLERPVTSATNSRRWNAYAGYNPTWMTKLIEIMRVYHNYCMSNKRTLTESGRHDESPTTPALRLGAAEKIYTANDILNFTPNI